MLTASGLIVRFLKVFEKSNYQSIKWVRYLTKAEGTYQVRVRVTLISSSSILCWSIFLLLSLVLNGGGRFFLTWRSARESFEIISWLVVRWSIIIFFSDTPFGMLRHDLRHEHKHLTATPILDRSFLVSFSLSILLPKPIPPLNPHYKWAFSNCLCNRLPLRTTGRYDRHSSWVLLCTT